MIYCNLKGGLGNMLFEIATTMSIAHKKNISYSFPNFETHLNYLNHDNIYNPSLKNAQEYKSFLNFIETTAPNKHIPTISYPFEYLDIEIPHQEFIIDGFFQSEKYFKNSRDLILEKFKLDATVEKELKQKYHTLLTLRTTSIHVRRGDYVKFSNIHPLMTLEYFESAIKILNGVTDVFLVFSDDIEWSKKNFRMDNVFFVENEKDYFELFLMSYCDNNIISNSSFSWWGGWLNQNNTKKVIAPSNWFCQNVQYNSKDIIPENWIKI